MNRAVFLVLLINADAWAMTEMSCPQLFGTARTHARNRHYRKRFLRWTEKDLSGITVAHSHQEWENVWNLRLGGLSLERKGADTLVRLSEQLADRLGCDAGRYLLTRDDSLGRETRTLALLGNVVLVAHRGRLAYLSVPGSTIPKWLLAWQLRGATMYSAASASGRPPRRSPPRRPPPKRPPPRPKPVIRTR